MKEKIISMRDLEVKFKVRDRELTAIRDVSLDIYKGEVLAIVGESGSGKSVLTKTLTGMLESNGYISQGDIYYYNEDLAKNYSKKFGVNDILIDQDVNDIKAKLTEKNKFIEMQATEKKEALKAQKDVKDLFYDQEKVNLTKIYSNENWMEVRGKKIATIFQDPMTSLNPLRKIGSQISEVIRLHRGLSKQDAKLEAIKLLKRVGILDAEQRFNNYPFQYSGGMRQRVVIAIALACNPDILICDEPTTALDVTIQAQIIDLIKELAEENNFTVLFITHDLGVVANVADRVAVMYAGQIVEYGTAEDVFYDPRHPYTWALLSSLPQLGEKGKELFSIVGTPPSLYFKVKGDAFAVRNPFAMKIDFEQEPPMFKINETHFAKTWLLDERAPKVEKPDIINDLSIRVAKLRGDSNGK